MKRLCCRKLLLSLLAVSVTAELGTFTTVAQGGASPAIALRRISISQNVWPGDFNGDGFTDLAGSEEPTERGGAGRVIVLAGDGRGSFSAPDVTSYVGRVLGVGDFNGDRKIDLIVTDAGSAHVAILPGNGNGTFAAPRVVSPAIDVTFALSSDLDADGRRDLIVGAEGITVAVFPGNGDFTFGPEITLTANASPHDGIIADFNSDGKKDLVVANHYFHGVTVFLNQGALQFSGADVAVGGNANDVTVSDVNRDGRLDLIVATSNGGDGDSSFTEGHAEVLLGRGDGTFSPGTAYDVPRGAWQVVAGDFTRDGMVDIATANRSSVYADQGCGSDWLTWDSVSILPGRPDGTFGAPSSFSLGNQGDVDDQDFKNQVRTLNTSDVNRDGATDLIASWGPLLLNTEGHPNVAPTVDAGPDQQLGDVHETVLQARAADDDQDMLTWTWTDASGAVIARWPKVCRSGLSDGVHVFTVTVDDGHGHRTSDTVAITVGSGGGAGTTVPMSADGDLGAVGRAGSARYNDGVFTVTASGADIWGTADAFHFVYGRTDTIDSTSWEATARVDAVQNVNAWTKAGVMIRAGFTANSPHASLIVSPGKGIAFQRRLTAGGVSVSTPGPALTAPVWLRLTMQRSGSRESVGAYYRKHATDPWILIGQDTFPAVMPQPLIGLAVTSHAAGTLATATFSNVRAAASFDGVLLQQP